MLIYWCAVVTSHPQPETFAYSSKLKQLISKNQQKKVLSITIDDAKQHQTESQWQRYCCTNTQTLLEQTCLSGPSKSTIDPLVSGPIWRHDEESNVSKEHVFWPNGGRKEIKGIQITTWWKSERRACEQEDRPTGSLNTANASLGPRR